MTNCVTDRVTDRLWELLVLLFATKNGKLKLFAQYENSRRRKSLKVTINFQRNTLFWISIKSWFMFQPIPPSGPLYCQRTLLQVILTNIMEINKLTQENLIRQFSFCSINPTWDYLVRERRITLTESPEIQLLFGNDIPAHQVGLVNISLIH